MSLEQAGDTDQFNPFWVNGYRQAVEFIEADEAWTPPEPGAVSADGGLHHADPIQVIANLRLAYETLAVRYAAKSERLRAMTDTSEVGAPCPACGRELDPDGSDS